MPIATNSDTLVLDNGGYSLKLGFSSQSAPRVVPNCIMKAKSEKRRAFIGDQIDDCRDLSSLFYLLPFQKGYLVNWDHQKTVWDYVFGKDCLNIRHAEKLNLIFTEPYFNFASIQEGLSEIFFEEYGFKSLLRTHPGDLSCYQNKLQHPDEKCCLVIDCGFSFTHIVPYILGKRVRNSVKRIDVGGKLLTNHLKEIISYRQLHVLDETHVMNGCKEDCCYVTQDWEHDVRIARSRSPGDNTIARDYVLPDFTSIRRGFMKSVEDSTGRPEEGEQLIRMNNERFMVPEILFRPSDIGICQMGLGEAVVECVSSCEESAQPWLYRNIVLTGGSVQFPGFRHRLETEVRRRAPAEMEVVVREPDDPVSYAWRGGASLAGDRDFRSLSVSREEYNEAGYAACNKRFYL